MSAAEKRFFDPASLDDEEEGTATAAQPTPPPVEATQPLSVVPPPAGQETDLSTQFSDPVLYDNNGQFQGTNADEATAAQPTLEGSHELLQETAGAVQELVGGVMTPVEESPDVNLALGQKDPQQDFVAQGEMAKAMFELVLCELKFDVLVEEVLRSLMKSVDAEVGSILEFDKKNNDFFFRAAIGGSPDKVKDFRVPAYKGIVGHVGESKQMILINDVEDSEMHLRSISIAVGFEAKSCIAAPIIVGGQIYGVIELFNKMGIRYFDAHDMRILEQGLRWTSKILEVRFFAAKMLQMTRK